MDDRIKNKINKVFEKYCTDCCVGIIRGLYDKERKVLVIRVYSHGTYDINIIGNTGINLLNYHSNKVLYIRDLQDIARVGYTIFFD